MIVATKLRFRSQLCEENVLASLTSIVLNDNHLVSFVNKIVIKSYENRFYIRMLDKIVGFAPTYSELWWGIQSYVILGKKYIFLDFFFYSAWRDVESRSYVSSNAMMNSKLHSFW